MSKPLAVTNRTDCAPKRARVVSLLTPVAAPSEAKVSQSAALPSAESSGKGVGNTVSVAAGLVAVPNKLLTTTR